MVLNFTHNKRNILMTKKQYKEMIRLKMLVHGTFGMTKHPSVPTKEFEKLYQEYMKLRNLYSECKGVLTDE